MNIRKKKIEFKNLLPKGLSYTFQILKKEIISSSPIFNELILLESRHHEVEQRITRGIINEQESLIGLNRIRDSLLRIIDFLESADLKEYTSSHPSDKDEITIDLTRDETILILIQLTNSLSEDPPIIDSCNSMRAVFEHFKPCIEVDLIDKDGRPVKERVEFLELTDFNPSKSNVIAELSDEIEILNKKKLENRITTEPYLDSLILDKTQILEENKKSINRRMQDLERNYIALDSFFANNKSNADCIYLINSKPPEQIDKTYSARLQDKIQNLNYLPQRKYNFDILVLPGSFKDEAIFDLWVQFSHKLKICLITDYENCNLEEFYEARIASKDIAYSNAIMTFNWILGKEANNRIDGTELFIPPSLALGGLINSNKISEPSVGLNYGQIQKAFSVKNKMTQDVIGQLDQMGLISIVSGYGGVMAYSITTLYKGPNRTLWSYPNVRVLDFVNKKVSGLLSKMATAPISLFKKKNMILNFLSTLKEDKILMDFDFRLFTDDFSNFELGLRTFFSLKYIIISFTQEPNSIVWSSKYTFDP